MATPAVAGKTAASGQIKPEGQVVAVVLTPILNVFGQGANHVPPKTALGQVAVLPIIPQLAVRQDMAGQFRAAIQHLEHQRPAAKGDRHFDLSGPAGIGMFDHIVQNFGQNQFRRAALIVLQAAKAVIAEQAELKAIEKSEAEWRAFQPRTQEEAEERRDRLDDLRIAREQTAQAMHQKAYQATQEAQHHDAKALADMRAELPKIIQGFSPELETKIAQFAVADLGFQPEEISAVRDPKIVKVLHLAMLGKQATAKQSAAKTVQAQQATAPAPQVGGKRAPPTGLDDRLSAEEWTRRRNEQIRKRGG